MQFYIGNELAELCFDMMYSILITAIIYYPVGLNSVHFYKFLLQSLIIFIFLQLY